MTAAATGVALTLLTACTSGSSTSDTATSASSRVPPTRPVSTPTASLSTDSSPAASAPRSSAPTATTESTAAAHRVARTSSMPPMSGPSLVAFVRSGRMLSAASFRVGALTPGQPLETTPGTLQFTTPSGNIHCGILGPDPEVVCDVERYSYATPPRPASCELNYAPGYISLLSSGVKQSLCLGGPPINSVSHTLSYGTTLVQGRLACRSEAAFLACADTGTAHGFVVSRTSLYAY